MMDIGKLRRQKKLKQTDIAIACGVSLSTARMWEIGVTVPTEENMVKLKKVLGVK